MGGFRVRVQFFGVYQAIEWLSKDNTSLQNQIRATTRIREMVDKGRTSDIVKLNIISRLMERLEKIPCSIVQSEIIWTLANIAAGTSFQTKLVLRKGLKKFIELLEANRRDGFKVDIVWILANIAGDSASCRDSLLNAGVVPIIIKLLKETSNLNLQKKCVWLMSNIVRHPNPPVDFDLISECIPVASKYLTHIDNEILSHTCWFFKYLTDGTVCDRNAVIASPGICHRLIDLIGHLCASVAVSALLVCINITAGTSTQADSLLACGLIPSLSYILSESDDQAMLKNTCFALSNIAAGTEDQIQKLIVANIFPKLVKVFNGKRGGKRVQIEIFHIINNTICCGNHDQFTYLVSTNLIEILWLGLFFEENGAIKQSLEGFLWSLEQQGFAFDFKFVQRINALESHEDQEICRLAQAIIQNLS